MTTGFVQAMPRVILDSQGFRISEGLFGRVFVLMKASGETKKATRAEANHLRRAIAVFRRADAVTEPPSGAYAGMLTDYARAVCDPLGARRARVFTFSSPEEFARDWLSDRRR